METLFARRVKAWPVCGHITFPCIVTFSAVCDVTATLPTEEEQPHLLDRGISWPQGLSGEL